MRAAAAAGVRALSTALPAAIDAARCRVPKAITARHACLVPRQCAAFIVDAAAQRKAQVAARRSVSRFARFDIAPCFQVRYRPAAAASGLAGWLPRLARS